MHVPHAMNKCNCKTNLEINGQGYMAVKLCICAIVVACHYKYTNGSKLHVCQMFVKEADGVVSYLEPSMEIVGG